LEYIVSSGSVTSPGDSTGSVTVGAMDFSNDQLESFSSRGPTNDNRIKPDISGPDGVTSSTLNPFFGTSAATPHVAGAAALLKEKFPTATADDLQNLLEFSTASFHTKSNDDGTGRVDLFMFVGSDIVALDNSNVNCTIDNTCFFPNTITINQEETVTWTNVDDAANAVFSGTAGGPAGELFTSPLLFRGDSFSHTFRTQSLFGTVTDSVKVTVGSLQSILFVQIHAAPSNFAIWSVVHPSPSSVSEVCGPTAVIACSSV